MVEKVDLAMADTLCDCYLCRELKNPYLSEEKRKIIVAHREKLIKRRDYEDLMFNWLKSGEVNGRHR